MRPNDLNKGHVRVNSPRDGVLAIDHMVAHGKFDDFDVCGTLLNKNPSKFKEGKRSVETFATVYICDVADYAIIEQGIAFVQNEDNISVAMHRVCRSLFKEHSLWADNVTTIGQRSRRGYESYG